MLTLCHAGCRSAGLGCPVFAFSPSPRYFLLHLLCWLPSKPDECHLDQVLLTDGETSVEAKVAEGKEALERGKETAKARKRVR